MDTIVNETPTAQATEGTVESAALSIRKKLDEAANPAPDKPIAKAQPAPVEAAEQAHAEEMPPDESGDATEEPDEIDAAGDEPVTIDAPSGWNAEEKEWFKTLEPVRQESILRQYKALQRSEAKRHTEYTAAMQNITEAGQAAQQQRVQLDAALQNYSDPLVKQFQTRFKDVLSGHLNPIIMAQQDPQRYQEFQAYQDQFRQIDAAKQTLAQQSQEYEQENLRAFRNEENARIAELRPELKDPARFQKWDQEVSQFLLEQDVPEERIMRISALELDIISDAMAWRKAKAASKAASGPQGLQNGQQQKQAPRVLKPANGNSNSQGADDKLLAARNRARKTGAVEDVALSIRAKLDKAAEARRSQR